MKKICTIKTINEILTSRDFVKGGALLSPWWVTGIADAEGKFSIILHKSKKCSCTFIVTQKGHSVGILFDLQRYFKCGKVILDNRRYNTYKFVVSKKEDLYNIIIPHFDKYPLVTSKNLDFLDFKKVLLMYEYNLHLINNNMEKIFFIKNNMNNKRPFDQRLHYHNCLKITENLNNEWVQAFIDGSGLFKFSINKKKKSFIPIFEIVQINCEGKVLERIKDFFGSGSLELKYDIYYKNGSKFSRYVNKYVLDQYYSVIKFIDKYPMLTNKQLDFQDWKRLIELKHNKVYNTKKGLLKMQNIIKGMNKHRFKLIVEPNVVECYNNLIISNNYNQFNLIKYNNKLNLVKFNEYIDK